MIKRIFSRIRAKINNLTWGRKGNRTVIIKPMRIINKKRIFLGDNVVILNDARMEVCSLDSKLMIGDGTSIEQGCHIISANSLEIGSDCVISAWVYISDCNHIYNKGAIRNAGLDIKKTRIGNNVFIGIGARIMPGVTIGDNAVIGANSVVTKDVPEREIWAGIPAKYIKNNK